MHITARRYRHTFTQHKTALWIPHCTFFSIDPITGQRSQDGPIPPQYSRRPPPTHFSPSSQYIAHSFILLSSHPSARLSSLTSSPLNGYWLCSQSFHSLSLPITNVSDNHGLIVFAYLPPLSTSPTPEDSQRHFCNSAGCYFLKRIC